ncbi:MAG TPA: ribonuclease Z [Solirubrobacteraceae bacterium]|nr:ribonuclease Z [Solirubrobacteraceae bacterium]
MSTHGVELSVFFAGTAGSVPTARRGLPAVLVRRGSERILVDCGEGTQRQLVASIGLADLTDIFLTHFHTDHWLGLPGLLNTFNLRGRDRPLTIHGPVGAQRLMELVRRMSGRPGFELRVTELESGDVLERDGLRIAAVAGDHRGPELGYVFFEDERPGVFDPDAARAAGLQPGPDFGRVQRGETVDGVSPAEVMGPPRAGRKLVISGDTRPTDTMRVAAHEADVLVHEATFADEERQRAWENGHSTARQAAGVARDAEVRLLALTHVSTRHPLGLLREEARAVFPDTVLPRDFDTIEIPYPERGAPRLVRWSEAQEAARARGEAQPAG